MTAWAVSVIMSVSPVQSGAKSGSSDFSIERILSDGKREESEAPSWLCCTRYQPPRIPRAASGSACRGRRSGRHARVPFTAAQAAALEAAYVRAPYLAPPALRALAAALQLRDDRIKIWFQNRRARERREKCSIVAPPQAIALPPTAQGTLLSTRGPWISRSREVPDNAGYSVMDTSHNPSRSTSISIPLMCNSSFSEGSDEDRTEDRPESPLDVETVED